MKSLEVRKALSIFKCEGEHYESEQIFVLSFSVVKGQRCHNQLILRGGTSYVKAGLFPAYSFHNEEILSLLSQVVLT